MGLMLRIFALILVIAAPLGANAFAPGTYAERSVLADGVWRAVEVESSGAVLLTTASLRRWGFKDPGRVRVYGAGAGRISDVLSEDNYVDDVPEVQCMQTKNGLLFYAVGPEEWSRSATGRFTHRLNPFATHATYFITESDLERRDIPMSGMAVAGADAATTFTERIYHELDEVSPGETGHMLLGEDLRYTSPRKLTFMLPGIAAGDNNVWIQARAVANISSTAVLSVTADDKPLAEARMLATPATAHGTLLNLSAEMEHSGERLTIGIELRADGIVSRANLDAIDLNYTRRLEMPSAGVIEFSLDRSEGILRCAAAITKIWDITDPLNITEVRTEADETGLRWHSSFGPHRRYMAWTENGEFMTPDKSRKIANQNLHYSEADAPDMVIFAPREWLSQAERIATLHRKDATDPLSVRVVDVEQVYNEFSSGTRDVGALRRMLKMVYDRGCAAGRPLRYALLLGRATHDNRGLTHSMAALGEKWLPTWQTDESLRENDSYTSDDILAMLGDGSGERMGADELSIGVGRIPAGKLETLKGYVDKLENYMADHGDRDGREWKNRVLVIADDGNAGSHMKQTERMIANMLETERGRNMVYKKAYIDAYDIVGGTCAGARERMMTALDEGTMWWHFTGHAGRSFLTGDNLLTYTDINNLSPRKLPVFVGATCSFMQWDGVEPSGCEIMALNPRGGIIAAISTTREVFVDDNGKLTDALGHEAFATDARGVYPTLGEILMRTKNRLGSPYGQRNDNKLRYALLGDPAMRCAMPANRVKLLSINGKPLGPEDDETAWPEISAKSTAELTGAVYSAGGELMSEFNGILSTTLYDAEFSTTSQGRSTKLDGDGERVTFEQQGERLFSGRDSVRNGLFSIRIPMPADIADNYRPAMLTMYARNEGGTEAAGCDRGFYVCGYDDTADTDTLKPRIDYIYLNHESFTPGGSVNASPMMIAGVSDDRGLNLSSAGIGRQMTLTLDGERVYTDVASRYTPSADGRPQGVIAYPLSDLATGTHTLSLRIFDVQGNMAEQSIEFVVDPMSRPTLFSVWTDASPATASANFYLSHDRPGATLKAVLGIYDLMGRLLWSTTVTDRSDMGTTAPIRWDLSDRSGHRVARGIYVYRATLTDPTGTAAPAAASGRIAVAAP